MCNKHHDINICTLDGPIIPVLYAYGIISNVDMPINIKQVFLTC